MKFDRLLIFFFFFFSGKGKINWKEILLESTLSQTKMCIKELQGGVFLFP